MERIEPPQAAAPPRGRVWRMAARAAIALLGGYAVAAGIATLTARLLPVARVEAVLWGMIVAGPLYAAISLWCFREPRLGRVAAIVLGGALLLTGSAWLLGVRP